MNEKLIDIDLTRGEVVVGDIPAELLRDYIGGLGLAVKYVYDEIRPGMDALGPDNIIVVAAGPLAGTVAPTNGRTSIATLSPLNGLLGMGNFGGWWGPRLRKAGYMAVRIRGAASKPVYLWIDDELIELRDASHLWGKDAFETTDLLKAEHGDDLSVLAIGQAGENLVKYACPVADYDHSPSRSNTGAVMGIKRFKGIAVRGTKKVPVADDKAFRRVAKESAERLIERAAPPKGSDTSIGRFYEHFALMASCGMFNCKNYQTTLVPDDSDMLRTREAATPHLIVGNPFGYHCLLEKYFGCQVVADVKTGPHAGTKVGGYCYVPTWGTACQLTSYPAMWKCHELTQRYGMDAPGIPIPYAMELYQRGLLSRDDCDGLDLTWGNEATTIELIRKTAFREGFGDLLAEGSLHMAKVIGKGAEKYSMSTKGVEIMAIEPRGGPVKLALGLMVNPRGGDDAQTTREFPLNDICAFGRAAGWSETECVNWLVEWLDMPAETKKQIFGDPPDPDRLRSDNPAGKATEAAWQSKLTPMFNSLGLCLYSATYYWALGPEYYARMMTAYEGEGVTAEHLIEAGERIANLTRAFICKAGIRRKDDDMPARFYDDPVVGGDHDGAVVSRVVMQSLLTEYYERMRWDPATGVPTRAALTDVGLAQAADELGL
jgi:aldehyde:ferredoxin oxidoreductase